MVIPHRDRPPSDPHKSRWITPLLIAILAVLVGVGIFFSILAAGKSGEAQSAAKSAVQASNSARDAAHAAERTGNAIAAQGYSTRCRSTLNAPVSAALAKLVTDTSRLTGLNSQFLIDATITPAPVRDSALRDVTRQMSVARLQIDHDSDAIDAATKTYVDLVEAQARPADFARRCLAAIGPP